MLETSTVPSIRVEILRDDRRIAWRLSWVAPTPASLVETAHFSDAVALQFPMADGAPFTMGGKGLPVRLIQWRAIWQKDIDEGFQDIKKVYPNSWYDLYWFSTTGAGPVPMASLIDPAAVQFDPARAAGNPMAKFDRTQPFDELVAEGFGTVTSIGDSPGQARGVWRDGRWTVVIDRPWDTQDPLIARLLAMGSKGMISLAVWDGSAGNRGGRKHHCGWVPMRIEP
jgi:hypothetical protein